MYLQVMFFDRVRSKDFLRFCLFLLLLLFLFLPLTIRHAHHISHQTLYPLIMIQDSRAVLFCFPLLYMEFPLPRYFFFRLCPLLSLLLHAALFFPHLYHKFQTNHLNLSLKHPSENQVPLYIS